MGGVVPGVLMGVALMVMVYVYSRNKNYAVSPRPTLVGLWGHSKTVLLPLLNPVIILSGMVGGVLTPTEAAAVAVAYALCLGKFVYRELTWRTIFTDCQETAKFCSTVYVIIASLA